MKRVSNRDASKYIGRLEEFSNSTGSLRGVKGRGWTFGMLPARFRGLKSLRNAEYTVYSYATPVAWFLRGVWYEPNVRYSMTTSHHMGNVRYGIHLSGKRHRMLAQASYRKTIRKPASTGMPAGYYGVAV